MSDLILLRSALRDSLRPGRLGAALLLVLLPALLGLLWRAFTPPAAFRPDEAYNSLAASLVFGFILTILSLLYGTGVVSQEIEQKTIVYLLTRPVPRGRILLAKFLGSLIAITATVLLSTLLLAAVVYGPGKIGAGRVLQDLRILPVGALVYGSLFLLLATLVSRPLTYGLLFVFGWESWVPSLPGTFPNLSIMAYLRKLAPHPASPDTSGSAFLTAFNPAAITTPRAWTVLAAVTALALGLALLIFSTREYAPRDGTE